MAQPVEQLIRNQQVRGSNPLGSFQLKNDPLDYFLICMATNGRLSQNCGSLFLLLFLTDCILFLIPVFEILQNLIEK